MLDNMGYYLSILVNTEQQQQFAKSANRLDSYTIHKQQLT